MKLETIPGEFSVCRGADFTQVDREKPWCFTAATEEEKSLVCPGADVPANALTREDGWRAFRVCGPLDFSLIGVLSSIAAVLAEHGVAVFVISTYDTDYILTRGADYGRALSALAAAGYEIGTAPGTEIPCNPGPGQLQ